MSNAWEKQACLIVIASVLTHTSKKSIIQKILNIIRLTPKTMKYCHDCLTPINRYSKEEYCAICKKDRALKESSTA